MLGSGKSDKSCVWVPMRKIIRDDIGKLVVKLQHTLFQLHLCPQGSGLGPHSLQIRKPMRRHSTSQWYSNDWRLTEPSDSSLLTSLID